MSRQSIRRLAATGAALCAPLVAASAQEAERSPAGAGARFPALARAEDGRVAMVWTERDADSVPVLKVAVRGAAGGWSAARAVVRDSALFVNFADFARTAFLSSGELVVTWLQRGGPGKYDYGIRVSRSRDGGATWSAPVVPYDARERGEHGFVSLVPLPGGSVALSFLNGWESERAGGAMHVDYATLDGAGRLAAVTTLDDRACDCCQTAAAATARGPIVVYRDRSPEEIRDMSVTRLVRGAWTPPVPLWRDGWHINACPVNGPAVAAGGERVAVAWFTAARDTAKVQLAFSDNAGETFTTPVRVDDGQPAGHVDVVLAADGSAWVSWLERVGENLDVRVRRVRRGEPRLAPTTLGVVSGVRPSGWPAMVAVRDGLLFAWTVPGKPTTIRVARVPGDAR